MSTRYPVAKQETADQILAEIRTGSSIQTVVHPIWLLDYKQYGTASYVYRDKDKLHELYRDYAISMNDESINGAALDYADSIGEAGLALAAAYGVDTVIASEPTITAVAASEVAMTAVVASETAMTAVTSSETAMTAVAASEVAMTVVAASETAMTAVVNSNVAMNNEDFVWGLNARQLLLSAYPSLTKAASATYTLTGSYSDAVTVQTIAAGCYVMSGSSEWSTHDKLLFAEAPVLASTYSLNGYSVGYRLVNNVKAMFGGSTTILYFVTDADYKALHSDQSAMSTTYLYKVT